MSCYISSNENRHYVAVESELGQVPAITAGNRMPVVSLQVKQTTDRIDRRDKTGGRTWMGVPTGTRKSTNYEIKSYLTGWSEPGDQPPYGALVAAAMGRPVLHFNGGTLASSPSATRLQFAGASGLIPGQAVTYAGELRFVSTIVDAQTVEVNAPFTSPPGAGSPMGATYTYMLGSEIPGLSIFDCWSPAESVQRLVCGAAANELSVKINADFHEFSVSGGAVDVLDSTSFTNGQGGMTTFPAEPELEPFQYVIVPGHLGQVWLGATPDRFYTLTEGEVKLNNGIDMRTREFGAEGPRCIMPGQRKVSLDFRLYEQNSAATRALYEAARQRSPIQAMFQLGQQTGQLLGVYAKSVLPQVPEFDDGEDRLAWKFTGCRAQGTTDDELIIAFA